MLRLEAHIARCQLLVVDELGYILGHEADIAAFEAKRTGSINTLAAS